jgi:hypothetical protein
MPRFRTMHVRWAGLRGANVVQAHRHYKQLVLLSPTL